MNHGEELKAKGCDMAAAAELVTIWQQFFFTLFSERSVS